MYEDEGDQEQEEGSAAEQDADLGAKAVEDPAQHQLADDGNNRVERNVGSDQSRVKTDALQVVALVLHDAGSEVDQESAESKHP